MKKQKLILFDWGNIVESLYTGYSNKKAWQDLFIACGYKYDEELYGALTKYRLTAIKNETEFRLVYDRIKNDYKLNKNFEEFTELYKSIFDKIDYYQDVRDYEHSLKDRCYIGILSNLTIYDRDRLDKQVVLSNYDYTFLSFEFGYRKPDIEIFEKVQSMISFEKSDILFIDDSEKNIIAAKNFGWNTLQASGLELDLIKKTCEEFLK